MRPLELAQDLAASITVTPKGEPKRSFPKTHANYWKARLEHDADAPAIDECRAQISSGFSASRTGLGMFWSGRALVLVGRTSN